VLTLAAIPWALARRDPDRVVLTLDGATLTAAELDRAACGAAELLRRHGVTAGGRVAVLCGNGFAFPVAHFGALRLGAVVAPVSTASAPAELAGALRRLRAVAVVADIEHEGFAADALRSAGSAAPMIVVDETADRSHGHRAALATLSGRPSSDPMALPLAAPAVLMGTSGTTGMPKRAIHSHVGLLLNARAVADDMLGLGPADVQLGALPLAHSFGLSAVLHASLMSGAGVVLMRRFEAEAAVQLLGEHGVTVVQGVPTMLARLTAAARGGDSVRRVVVSGAPLPDGLAALVHARLCTDVVERWGLTEASPLTMRAVPAGGGEPGDVGHPLRGVVVRVAGDPGPGVPGELEAAAPTLFLGYLGDRQGTAAAVQGGFLRTGDLGSVGADARVRLHGRLKDVIVRGGNNVGALEVERALESHPAVAEVAVLGLPDAELGEEVAAVVVLRAWRAAAEEELAAHCRQRLAGYKVPRRWAFEPSLPRTSTGKVRKGELRRLFPS
jgi:long-chain acyl-CoA synthetase